MCVSDGHRNEKFLKKNCFAQREREKLWCSWFSTWPFPLQAALFFYFLLILVMVQPLRTYTR